MLERVEHYTRKGKKVLCKIHIALLSPIIMSLLLLSFLPLRLMINASTSYTSDNKTFLKNVGQEYRAFSSSDFPFWRKLRPWGTKCIYMVTQPTESILEEVCMHEKRKLEGKTDILILSFSAAFTFTHYNFASTC